MRRVIALLPLALVIVIATGCGSGGSGSETKTGTNEFGDPYITNAQAQSVHEGEADTAVFAGTTCRCARTGVLGLPAERPGD